MLEVSRECRSPNLLTPVFEIFPRPVALKVKSLYVLSVETQEDNASEVACKVVPNWSKSSTTKAVFEAGVLVTTSRFPLSASTAALPLAAKEITAAEIVLVSGIEEVSNKNIDRITS